MYTYNILIITVYVRKIVFINKKFKQRKIEILHLSLTCGYFLLFLVSESKAKRRKI